MEMREGGFAIAGRGRSHLYNRMVSVVDEGRGIVLAMTELRKCPIIHSKRARWRFDKLTGDRSLPLPRVILDLLTGKQTKAFFLQQVNYIFPIFLKKWLLQAEEIKFAIKPSAKKFDIITASGSVCSRAYPGLAGQGDHRARTVATVAEQLADLLVEPRRFWSRCRPYPNCLPSAKWLHPHNPCYCFDSSMEYGSSLS